MTNHSKLGGPKQLKCILSQFWGPDVQQQSLWAEIKVLAALPLEAPGRIQSLLFHPLVTVSVPWPPRTNGRLVSACPPLCVSVSYED